MYNKILLCLCLSVFIGYVYSLECHVSDFSTEKNQDASKKTCKKEIAEESKKIIEEVYKDVTIDDSKDFECFEVQIKGQKDDNKKLDGWYKSCIYKTEKLCDKKIADKFKDDIKLSNCKVCDKDNCNPAGRAVASFSIVSLTALLAFFSKIFS